MPAMPAASSQSHRTFALDMHRALASGDENVLSSPISIELALGMLSAGAAGETSAALSQLLRLPDGTSPFALHGAVMDAWSGAPEGYELAVANRVFAANGVEFTPAFLATTAESYGAAPETVDFAKDPEGARRQVNAWVSEQTRAKIPELFQNGDIETDTRLTLVNAVYFKGLWANPFQPELTMPAPFATSGGSVEADFLRGEKRVLYAEDEDLQAVLIPYKGEKAGFLAILPKDPAGLVALESHFDAERLQALTRSMKAQEVDLWLPKVDLNTRYNLRAALTAMGGESVFSSSADFSKLTSGEDRLVVDTAIHEVVLTLDEQGTEAAAATGIGIKATSLKMNPIFRADRPFLFAVWERDLELPVFFGRLSDPS
jgi:serpin B